MYQILWQDLMCYPPKYCVSVRLSVPDDLKMDQSRFFSSTLVFKLGHFEHFAIALFSPLRGCKLLTLQSNTDIATFDMPVRVFQD